MDRLFLISRFLLLDRAGNQIMFWNSFGKIICDAPNGGMNWAVGNIGYIDGYDSNDVPEPNGIIQSLGAHVSPRSLYYSQLKDRMGANALHSVVIPSQDEGTIWDALDAWNGDGLFGDAVVVWYDHESIATTNGPVSIGGQVRDLKLLGSVGLTYSWSKLAGPGSVSLVDASSLETSVWFGAPGVYDLELEVSDGTEVEFAFLSILIS